VEIVPLQGMRTDSTNANAPINETTLLAEVKQRLLKRGSQNQNEVESSVRDQPVFPRKA
jgi:hypothetical protein